LIVELKNGDAIGYKSATYFVVNNNGKKAIVTALHTFTSSFIVHGDTTLTRHIPTEVHAWIPTDPHEMQRDVLNAVEDHQVSGLLDRAKQKLGLVELTMRNDLLEIRKQYLLELAQSKSTTTATYIENLDPYTSLPPSTTVDIVFFDVPPPLAAVHGFSIADSLPKVDEPTILFGFHSPKNRGGDASTLQKYLSVSVGKVKEVGALVDVISSVNIGASGGPQLNSSLHVFGLMMGSFVDSGYSMTREPFSVTNVDLLYLVNVHIPPPKDAITKEASRNCNVIMSFFHSCVQKMLKAV